MDAPEHASDYMALLLYYIMYCYIVWPYYMPQIIWPYLRDQKKKRNP